MPATDVIFRIGTLGITKAQAELGAVVAGLVQVGRVLAEHVKDADAFSDAWSRLSKEQKSAVQSMDTAVKGFIPTMKTMESSAKLATAELEPTNKQMASLALLAADTAKKLGEGPEGAARRLDELTNSLIKGTDRGLKPYGIELKSTGTLSEKQAEAFDKITKAADGLTLELDGLDDKLASLQNGLNKTVGLTYDWLEGSTKIGSILDTLRGYTDNWNKLLVASNGNVLDYVTSIEGLNVTFMSLGNRVLANTAAFYGFGDAAAAATARVKELQQYAAVKGVLGEIPKAKPTETEEWLAGAYSQEGGEEWMPEYEAPMVPGIAEEPKKKKGGGGGGGKAKPSAAYEGAAIELQIVTEIENTRTRIRDLVAEEETALRNAASIHEAMLEADKERAEYIERQMAIGGGNLTQEEKYEYWAAEEEHSMRMIALDNERTEYLTRLSLAQGVMAASMQTFSDKETVLTKTMRYGFQAVNAVAVNLFRSMITGSKESAQSIKKMIAEVMAGMAIEYLTKALAEAAEALICLAKKDYTGAAKHGAAAAESGVVAAAAGVAAASLGSSASQAGGSYGSQTALGGGYSGYEGDYSDESGEGPTEIKIFVDGSMANLFSQLTFEANKQKKSGAWNGGW